MRAPILTGMLLAAGVAAAAEMYRWVDQNGRVQYSDTPPPPSAKSVQQRKMPSSTIATDTMPFAVQQAAKNFPVTLWVTNCGEGCTVRNIVLNNLVVRDGSWNGIYASGGFYRQSPKPTIHQIQAHFQGWRIFL